MTAHTKHRGPRGRRLEFLAKRLDLTDDQVDTLRERLGEHRRQTVTIIRDVLTDEQRAKFDAHVERRKARGRGGRRGRGHGRGHRRGGWDGGATEPAAPADPATDLDGPTDAA